MARHFDYDDLLAAFVDLMTAVDKMDELVEINVKNPALIRKVWVQLQANSCAFEGCEKQAEGWACGRSIYGENHPKPALYCDGHCDVVSDEGNPEYKTNCKNCGCLFGVG